MNLRTFLQRGAAHAPTESQRQRALVVAEAEKARTQWLNALLVDQTRAWLSLGEYDAGVLSGLATVLALAGFAHVYDGGAKDSPDVRVIRGAISAATQCAKSGCALTAAHAEAFSSAARRADAIIRAASVDAIVHASMEIQKVVKL